MSKQWRGPSGRRGGSLLEKGNKIADSRARGVN